MDAAQAITQLHSVQAIFNYLSILHLDDYKYPKKACVEDSQIFDFIIVGGGTAGCVIANRLIEVGNVSVLLIEAGEDPPVQTDMPGSYLYLKKTRVDWNFTSVRDRFTMSTHKNNDVHMTQGKMLGGTGSLGYTGYERGNEYDYDRWAKLTNDRTWSWKSVQRAFHKNEHLTDEAILNSTSRRFYGTHGKIKIMKEYFQKNQEYFAAFRELGYDTPLDINPDTPLGFTDVMFNIGDGERQSTARKFLSPIKSNPYLYVLKSTLVTKINFNRYKRATGVEFVTKSNKTVTVKARKEVIVSAGVINSPKLLMLSGIGPKLHLTSLGIGVISDLPVGYNFQDHINMILVYKMTKAKKETILKDPHRYPYTIFDGYVDPEESRIIKHLG